MSVEENCTEGLYEKLWPLMGIIIIMLFSKLLPDCEQSYKIPHPPIDSRFLM